MERGKYFFTSESVSSGHPDKVCDRISDSILDEFLKNDKESHVAIETMISKNSVYLCGEISSNYNEINYKKIVTDVLKEIGYNNQWGFDVDNFELVTNISKQSSDINQGVSKTTIEEQGAGDQGIMFGYATDETKEYMPATIIYAHKLIERLEEVRKNNIIENLGPDAKSQVTFEFENGIPKRIDAVVIAQQHSDLWNLEDLRKEIKLKVIEHVCGKYLDENTKYFINATGKFVTGGPLADVGLTGRKIIVDTYGGVARHGGGAFSGKDPSKVDRSAAYAARFVAKNVVANKLAKRCEIQIGYCIGVEKPVSIFVDSFGTGNDEEIEKLVIKNFDLRPGKIIEKLKLKNPIYSKTSSYGHFGRDIFEWEKIIDFN
ncbi:MAG: methionine adenosyltransferase [Candidatus Nanoarchaeia archaeon]|nr:methionine adenosyltransferase [Candidatus Nanoarchaeia archaeon]